MPAGEMRMVWPVDSTWIMMLGGISVIMIWFCAWVLITRI